MTWVSPLCLFITGCTAWILGLASIGLWVGCYYECPTGRDTDFNYYVAVWTGVVAFFTGIFHMVFCFGRRKAFSQVCLWGAACCSFVLLPCSLLLTIFSAYLSWREWDTEQKYQEELDRGNDPEKLEGSYVAGIAMYAFLCVIGVLLLIMTVLFNCYHCCGNAENYEEELEIAVEPTTNEEGQYGQHDHGAANNNTFYSPPPAQYVKETNTQRGRAYRAEYGHTTRNGDYHQAQPQTTRSKYQYTDNARSHASRSTRTGPPSSHLNPGPPYSMSTWSTSRGPDYPRSTTRTSQYPTASRADPRSSNYPTTRTSHYPGTAQRSSNHPDNHRFNYRRDRGYDSQPSAGMRWEQYDDNPWSFSPRSSNPTVRSQNLY